MSAVLANLASDGQVGVPQLSEEEMEVAKQRQAEQQEQRIATLAALGDTLCKQRAEAIGAKERDIEPEWIEDEEFYQGIDDANRHEFHASSLRKKPSSCDRRSWGLRLASA